MLQCDNVRNVFKNEILKIVENFILLQKMTPSMPLKRKIDGSFVTEVDLEISHFIKSKIFMLGDSDNFNFYSEEDIGKFEWPIIILDPIDGTRELVGGIPECAVSLAVIQNQQKYDYWVFNPFNRQEIFKGQKNNEKRDGGIKVLKGAVSRTEWTKGFFEKLKPDSEIEMIPVGSIANKLMMLGHHQVDFVVSFAPKNIWDIAAGTLSIWERGYNFYMEGKKINFLNIPYYKSPLIWCKDEHYDKLKNYFFRV